MFCKECGNQIPDDAAICMKCGVPVENQSSIGSSSKSRVTFVLLGLFLGTFGIHNFYAGYIGRAVAQLLITLLTPLILGFFSFILILGVGVWVLVEICTVTQDSQGKRLK